MHNKSNQCKKTVHLYTEYEFMLCNKGYTSEYNKPSVTAPHSADKTEWTKFWG